MEISEWLFEGIGGGAILLLTGYIVDYYRRTRRRDKGNPTKKNIQKVNGDRNNIINGNNINIINNEVSNTILSSESTPRFLAIDKTPDEIQNEIKQASPYDKNTVAEKFIGLPIKWILEITSIDTKRNTITCCYGLLTVVTVRIKNLDDYPFLKVTNNGDFIEVEGYIRAMMGTFHYSVEGFNLRKIKSVENKT